MVIAVCRSMVKVGNEMVLQCVCVSMCGSEIKFPLSVGFLCCITCTCTDLHFVGRSGHYQLRCVNDWMNGHCYNMEVTSSVHKGITDQQ